MSTRALASWGFGEDGVTQTYKSHSWAHREAGECPHAKLPPTHTALIPGAGGLAVKWRVGGAAVQALMLPALSLGFGTVTVPDAGFQARLAEFFLCKPGMTNIILAVSLWLLYGKATRLSAWHKRGVFVKISFPVLKRNQKSTQTQGSAYLEFWHLAFSQGRRGPERLLLLLPLFVP